MTHTNLDQLLQSFIKKAPFVLVERICHELDSTPNGDFSTHDVVSLLPNKELKDLWIAIAKESSSKGYSAQSLVLALHTSNQIAHHYRHQQQVELVWTGPLKPPFILRRTDEALLQIITNSHRKILLVSFAVYAVPRITHALTEAVLRGVEVQLFIETNPDKISKTSGKQFLKNLPDLVDVYTWSDTHRIPNDAGQYGALHAKLAIGDSETMLVSSANLTENALSLNIEMGILISDGILPQRVERMFSDLVAQNIFMKIQ